jgi:hypothetical protein
LNPFVLGIYINRTIGVTGLTGIELRDATFEILDAYNNTGGQGTSIEYKTDLGISTFIPPQEIVTYISIANNLPDLTQANFVKAYLQKTNSVVSVDERTQTATIKSFSNLLLNLSNPIDWSNKIDFIEKPKTEFVLDYAANNVFKYKDDDDVIKPFYTDYTLVLPNENSKGFKTIVELPYSATDNTIRLGNRAIAQIKAFENFTDKIEFKPRCLLVRFENFTFSYRKTLSTTTGEVIITTDVPVGYFIDNNMPYSYGFERNLFPEFFGFLTQVLANVKKIEVKVRLSLLDVVDFDFTRPVYIEEFGVYFYVSRIKFDYTNKNSSIVELVKIL